MESKFFVNLVRTEYNHFKTVHHFLAPYYLASASSVLSRCLRQASSSHPASPCRITIFRDSNSKTSETKRSSASLHHRVISTRAGSGFETEESGLGPGPRRAGPNCGKLVEPQGLQPSDSSSSRCLEKGYGKPLKPARRPLLNFCKRVIGLKEKPSNCPPCPEPEPEQSFWDYLFKIDDKKRFPDPATCRVAQRRKEACRRTDPRLCDPRYRRTDGDVLVFTEAERPRSPKSGELEPRSPPGHKPPKAVVCRRIVEAAPSGHPAFRTRKKEVSCSGPPRSFWIPFEECRPPQRRRKPFTCDRGTRTKNVAPPISLNRSTCGGRSIGEYLAEATIERVNAGGQRAVDTKGEPAVDVDNRSRVQRLRQLTEHADDCVKEKSKMSGLGERNEKRNVSTESCRTSDH